MSAVSNSASVSQFQIAVARKQLDQAEQQGKDAVKLIEAATPPSSPANVAASVGTQLDVVA
jgi:hypothetical protein